MTFSIRGRWTGNNHSINSGLILVSQNETTKNHARTEVIVIHGVKDVHTPCYGPLHQALKKDNFDVIFINEFAPPDPKHIGTST